MLRRTGMPRYTEHTLTEPAEFLDALATARRRGYALDEGEQEIGVRCVAVVVPGAPQPMALSMSGPLPRMGDDVITRSVPVLRRAAGRIGAELDHDPTTGTPQEA